jgi:hypothetical protein
MDSTEPSYFFAFNPKLKESSVMPADSAANPLFFFKNWWEQSPIEQWNSKFISPNRYLVLLLKQAGPQQLGLYAALLHTPFMTGLKAWSSHLKSTQECVCALFRTLLKGTVSRDAG